MPVGLAAGVEAVGLGELRRIAVGGTDADMDVGAGRQRLAADLEVGRKAAVAELVGALEAQAFLDAALEQPGVSPSGAPARRESAAAHRPCCRSGWSWSRGRRSAGRCSSAPAPRASAARRRPRRGSACPGCHGRRPAAWRARRSARRDRPRTPRPPRCPPPAARAPRPARARPGSPANSGGTARGRRPARPACRRSPRPADGRRSPRPGPCGALLGMALDQPSTTASMRACSVASARGVKAAASSLRTRVCKGGSLKTRLVVWCL